MLERFWERLEAWLGKPYLQLSAPNGAAYLARWKFLNQWWGAIYLHRIDGPDPDPDPHNHPWEGLVIVLRKPGAYTQNQVRFDERGRRGEPRRERVGRLNFLGAGYHQIVSIAPGTWTLCLCGPRREREWGFLREDGTHEHWKPYVDSERHQKSAIGVVSGVEMGGR